MTNPATCANEIDRLRAIVDKLPKTADGVTVVPGMTVWCEWRCRGSDVQEVRVIAVNYAPADEGESITIAEMAPDGFTRKYGASWCCSTREAAVCCAQSTAVLGDEGSEQ